MYNYGYFKLIGFTFHCVTVQLTFPCLIEMPTKLLCHRKLSFKFQELFNYVLYTIVIFLLFLIFLCSAVI